MWASELKVQLTEVDINEHFVNMGGYSLLVIILVDKINKEFSLTLALEVIIEKPTITDLAQHIFNLKNASIEEYAEPNENRDAQSVIGVPMVIPNPEKKFDSFALTDLQQAYWIGEKGIFEHGGPAFFYEEYQTNELDVARFNVAVNKVISRHPALRTIVLDSGEQQVIKEIPYFKAKYIDLTKLADHNVRQKIDDNSKRLKANPLSSSDWPLFDFYIFKERSAITVQMIGRLLVFDGVSWQIFASDLQAFYDDPSLHIEEYELTFRDYINTIDAYKDSSEEYQRSLNFWKERIHSLPAAPQLSRSRNANTSSGANILTRRKYALKSSQWKKLKAITKKRKLTPTAVVCAIFCDVLATWSKAPNFTLNMMYGNRQPIHADVNKILGNFSTTLLLEVDINYGETFFDRANAIQNRLFRDLEHGIVSGVKVIREINSQSQSGVSPVMPIVFSSSLGGVQEDREFYFLEKLGWTRIEGKLKTPQVVFDHQVFVTNGELILNWDTEDCEFPVAMLDDMFSSYTGMINDLCDSEDLWNSNSRSTIPEKQLNLRYETNKTDAPVSEELLYAGFLDSVEKYADNIAVICGEEEFTYQEIYNYSMCIMDEIVKHGVSKGEIIAVIQPKGWEQIVSVLGVLMAGCVYLPLTTNTPNNRIDYILNICDVKIVLTKDQKYNPDSLSHTVKTIPVSEIKIDGQAKKRSLFIPSTTELAYIIFTSGSTGQPKGVMIDHRGAVNTINDINSRFSVNDKDRVLALSELNFDLSVYDVFGTLSVGATIVIPDHSNTVNPQHLAEVVKKHAVTVWNSVPAYIEMQVEYLSDKTEEFFQSLRLVMMSGDWIPVSLPARLNALNENINIVSLGGATEASIWSNYYIIDDYESHSTSIPYGYPLTNQRMYVLDKNLKFRPDWVPGEIYIAGTGLAMGYFSDEVKTKSSFIVNPQTGERLYRTGDWGRYLESGAIEFLGREDSQVKIRGYRIELGEIESVLNKHDKINEIVVLALSASDSAKYLVAYYTTQQNEVLDTQDLKEFSGKKLSSYMIPVDFVHLDSLPLTGNGKINRKELLTLYSGKKADSDKSTDGVPTSITEHKLLKIWKELLNIDHLSIHDDFFSLGGHSIMAVQMVGRIDKYFDKQVPLSILYEKGNIQSLAYYVDNLFDEEWSSLVTINKTGSLSPIFFVHPIGGNVLCYAQLAEMLGDDQPIYGLQSYGLNKKVHGHETVEEMADYYVNIIQNTIVDNTCKIIGWSMGGVIGYEVARRLSMLNVNVQLVMIDSWLSKLNGETIEIDESNLTISFFKDFCNGQLDRTILNDLVIDDSNMLESMLVNLRKLEKIPESISASETKTLLNVYKANTIALWKYHPEYMELPTSLLVAKENSNDMFANLIPLAQENRDKNLSDKMKIRYLDGDHYSIFNNQNIEKLVGEIEASFS